MEGKPDLEFPPRVVDPCENNSPLQSRVKITYMCARNHAHMRTRAHTIRVSIPTDLFINSISTFKNFRETRYSTLYCTSRKLLLFFSQAIPFVDFFFLYHLCFLYTTTVFSSFLRCCVLCLFLATSFLLFFRRFYLLANLHTLSCVPYHSILYTWNII